MRILLEHLVLTGSMPLLMPNLSFQDMSGPNGQRMGSSGMKLE